MLKRMLVITAITTCSFSAVCAFASVDNTPKPGGVLPIKPGVFVAKGQDCADPANAGIRIYDGKGIHGSATHACVAKIVKQKGKRYVLDQSCIDTPAGDGPRKVARESILIKDALTFIAGEGVKATSFTYCPVSELPSWLRQ